MRLLCDLSYTRWAGYLFWSIPYLPQIVILRILSSRVLDDAMLYVSAYSLRFLRLGLILHGRTSPAHRHGFSLCFSWSHVGLLVDSIAFLSGTTHATVHGVRYLSVRRGRWTWCSKDLVIFLSFGSELLSVCLTIHWIFPCHSLDIHWWNCPKRYCKCYNQVDVTSWDVLKFLLEWAQAELNYYVILEKVFTAKQVQCCCYGLSTCSTQNQWVPS